MSEYTYQPDDIEQIKKELYVDYGLSMIVTKEDVDTVEDKLLIIMYEKRSEFRDNINGMQTLFLLLTGMLPTQPGGFYMASREIESGFFSWGMINFRMLKPNLVWIPEKHYTYHRDRLASGLIAITPTNI